MPMPLLCGFMPKVFQIFSTQYYNLYQISFQTFTLHPSPPLLCVTLSLDFFVVFVFMQLLGDLNMFYDRLDQDSECKITITVRCITTY